MASRNKFQINTTKDLYKLLASEEPKFVRVLSSNRKAVQNVITYQEVFQMIQTGELTPTVINALQEFYGNKLAKDLANLYGAAIDAGIDLTERNLKVFFSDERDVFLAKYVLTRGANLVARITDEQKLGLKDVLMHYIVKEPLSPDDLATYIRANVGLTRRQMETLRRMAAELRATGNDEKTIQKIILREAKRMHQWRAETIARTELANVYEHATNEMVVHSATELGLQGQKQWLTAPDELVCEICSEMNGVKVNLNGYFDLPNGQTVDTPPAHPNCRCTLLYELH